MLHLISTSYPSQLFSKSRRAAKAEITAAKMAAVCVVLTVDEEPSLCSVDYEGPFPELSMNQLTKSL